MKGNSDMPENQLKQQALSEMQAIDDLIARVPGSRDFHDGLRNGVATIRAAIMAEPEKPAPEAPEPPPE